MSVRYAGALIAVMTAINLLNYIDRQVLSAVLEPLKAAMSLGDDQLGALQPAFLLSYTVLAPVFGLFGDRGSRTRLVAVACALWSVATAASGLVSSYEGLFAARACVGVGEAAYAAVAPSLIADVTREGRLGRAMAWFYVATPVGSALGYVVGGAVASQWGVRAAFVAAAVPGLVLALVMAAIKDPRRSSLAPQPAHGDADVAEDERSGGAWRRVAAVLRGREWRRITLTTTLYTFSLGALAFWAPTYLHRATGWSSGAAAMGFGAVMVVAGLAGTILGGWLGDRAQRRSPRGHERVSGWGFLLGAPALAIMPWLSDGASMLTVAAFGATLLFLNTGPLNAALVDSLAPGQRALGVAVTVFVIHAAGDAISPPMLGAVSERWGLDGLRWAMSALALPVLVAAAVCLVSRAAAAPRRD